jgi:hypothetical protein
MRPVAERDQDEVFVEYTKSISPVCKVVVDTQVNIRDDKVFLRTRCREHGQFEAMVYGGGPAYLASARFNKPGTIPPPVPRSFSLPPGRCCPARHACLWTVRSRVPGDPAVHGGTLSEMANALALSPHTVQTISNRSSQRLASGAAASWSARSPWSATCPAGKTSLTFPPAGSPRHQRSPLALTPAPVPALLRITALAHGKRVP